MFVGDSQDGKICEGDSKKGCICEGDSEEECICFGDSLMEEFNNGLNGPSATDNFMWAGFSADLFFFFL